MKGKIIAVFIMTLLIVTTIPAIGNMNIGKINFEKQSIIVSMDDSNPVSALYHSRWKIVAHLFDCHYKICRYKFLFHR